MYRLKTKKRIKIMAYTVLILFFTLIVILTKVCIFPAKEITSLKSQYERNVLTYYPRGTIKDRSGIKFTNIISKDNTTNIPDVLIGNVGKSFIGNINIKDNNTTSNALSGVSGLELYYDNILNGGSPINIIADVDATGKTIGKNQYKTSNDHVNQGSDINTTVDYNLQKYSENYLKTYLKKHNLTGGSVILTDVTTGEILCLVSSDDNLNKNFLSYQPGSIFKTLTLALCLDNNLVSLNEKFDCTGKIKIGNTTRDCHNQKGHGKIDVLTGYSESCNTVFYDLAKRLNVLDRNGKIKTNKLIEYANKLGFGSISDKTNKNKKFILEYNDYYSFVPDNIYNDLDTFNLALGQGTVQATPYLINIITAAISNGGSTNYPYIVKNITSTTNNSITYENESEKFDLKLKKSTIKTLQEAMSMVGSEGTARNNSLKTYGGLAGKTGTAENNKGSEDHSWFTGYFPATNPKYAMTVFIENGGYGSSSALDVFNAIAKEVLGIN